MGRLSRIDIINVHPIETDDVSEDEVYFISFLGCGDDGAQGRHPGSQVPLISRTATRWSKTQRFSEGKKQGAFTDWGRLYPTHQSHGQCCREGPGDVVSGPVFFFDQEPDSGDGSKDFWDSFGIVTITIISIGVSLAVAAPLAGNPVAAVGVGGTAALAVGGGLTAIWKKVLNWAYRDDYLGGVRLSFPCESQQQTIEETHELQGASKGIRSESTRGKPSIKWDDSDDARYKVTFRATYST